MDLILDFNQTLRHTPWSIFGEMGLYNADDFGTASW